MILFSSVLGEHKLTFTKLSKCLNHLTVAAIWAETEWGYIRNKGIESRKKILLDMSESVYVGTLADKPVAMFALVEQESLPIKEEWEKLPAVRQLMYVYVEKNYRGLGFGQQILKEAKKQATLLGADLILLDTLKPGLNRMYMKEGAEFVCENQLFSHPTDVLKMTL
ncbi:GNAT family N-acetyltransferase [Legionella cardiaca]|uniref:GNAT family N-acetyltransferase n=1 Tax=Legionella cardiaca TaxID=1071983 RepID=A0ABY8AYY4_9GAMM|nr:GNAT family N-acetyltransferase [Legionella cardiaca]WED44695.1 GNAT family N-acetyltransferase [Legionella cardiaca]